MTLRVLVAYASRYGATREIAERIGAVLAAEASARAVDLALEVEPAGEVTAVSAFDAVILGSGVYSGEWLPDAAELLESFRDELRHRPVWLFSDGPTAAGDPVELLDGWTFPASLAGLAKAVAPRGVALFAGRIDERRLSLEDWLLNRSMRGVVGDFRNWEAIGAWARGIAGELFAAAAAASVPGGAAARRR